MTKCKHEKIVTWRFGDGYEPAGLWSCAHCNLKFAPMAETFAAGLERGAEIVEGYKADCYCEGDDISSPVIICGPCEEKNAISDAIRAEKEK
jgi:hypothetical protein